MRIIKLIFFIYFTHNYSEAQTWYNISESTNGSVRCLYFDSTLNCLFAGGNFTQMGIIQSRGIAVYNGASWDSLLNGIDDISGGSPNFTNNVLTIEGFNNEIFVGGAFNSSGNYHTKYFSKWNGFAWDSIGINPNAPVYKIKNINDTLYICGVFDSVNSMPMHGISKFYNGVLSDVYQFPHLNVPNSRNQVATVETFNGNLYVGGNFEGDSGRKEITYWNGIEWGALNNGVLGSAAWISSMVVYESELYIGGYFTKLDGNAGNSIMRWNGSQWFELDNGIGGVAFPQVFDMKVIKNELFVVGTFQSAGNISCSNLAKWDGVKWCSVYGQFDNGISSIVQTVDSLVVGGGFWTIDSDSIISIAITPIDSIDSCSASGIDDIFGETHQLDVFPNPALDNVSLRFWSNRNEILVIKFINTIGDCINQMQGTFLYGINEMVIDLQGYDAGLYIIELKSERNSVNRKFIKLE